MHPDDAAATTPDRVGDDPGAGDARRPESNEGDESGEEERTRDADGSGDDGGGHRADLRYAAAGGTLATVVAFVAMSIVGLASSGEAKALVQAILPTVRFAASAYVAAGSTILALMLTMITFSISHDGRFRSSHFRRIRQIAVMTTTVIVASTLILMFLSFPLLEGDTERSWYLPVYYVLLFVAAVTGGMFISAILMLFYASRELLDVADSSVTSDLLLPDDDQHDDQDGGATSRRDADERGRTDAEPARSDH